MIKNFVKKFVSDKHPLVLFFYKLKAIVACMWYGFPSRNIKVIGVTGTDGKTTTVNLIAQMLEFSGKKVGLTSTLKYKVGDLQWSNRDKMTTQSPFVVQKLLRMMVDEGCDYAILEVTSHAVVQSRIWGINFDVAVFTNLTEDHLDYHGSMENYMKAKGGFIGSLYAMRRKSNAPKVLVLNGEDKYFEYFDQFKGDLKIKYGLNKGDVYASEILLSATGSLFSVNIPNDSAKFKVQLIGEFNIYNCLAAISVGLSQGIELKKLAAVFEKVLPVGGRLETVDVGQDFSVVVDYAHTADSLSKTCALYKGLTKGRLILVFGATGGGRDKGKRPIMGEQADRLADIIILTNDDPYFDDQFQIIEDIAKGIKRTEGEQLYKIVDRVEAIKFALDLAQKGDSVLIAGKGGEEVIVIGDKKIPHDDRLVVREYLSEKLYTDLVV